MEPDSSPLDNASENLPAKAHNQSAWDRMARGGHRFAKPAKDEDFKNPLKTVDRWGWLGESIFGKRVLCLAAGGGRQGPLYAAAGAVVVGVPARARRCGDCRPEPAGHARYREANLPLRTMPSATEAAEGRQDAMTPQSAARRSSAVAGRI